MSWLITWNGSQLNSDDMTIADLGRVEKDGGTPWSVANPFREVSVAKAFLGVAMRRSGMTDTETAAAVDTLTLRKLKAAFEWVDDDADGQGEQEEADPSAPPQDPTTPGS